MHVAFGEWYRSAGMDPDGDSLPKRWAAIDTYSPERDEVIFLAKLFFGLGKPNEALQDAFQKVFLEADPLFKTRDNSHELAVLAGAELIDLIERGDQDLADLAALSLVCAAAANLRNTAAVKEIPELAAKYLNKRTVSRSSLKDSDVATSPLSELAAGHPQATALLRKMERDLMLVREESNMLWWLFSGYSRDLSEVWAEVPIEAVPVVAAKELSDLTIVIPGPVAARAFLDRVIRQAKPKYPATIALSESINQLPLEWREKYTTERCPTEIESLLPITSAVKTSLGAPKDDAWLPALAQATGISSKSKLPPSILGQQVFLEGLLSRSWKENG